MRIINIMLKGETKMMDALVAIKTMLLFRLREYREARAWRKKLRRVKRKYSHYGIDDTMGE